MPTSSYFVEPVVGLKRSDRRGIAFLSGPTDEASSAREVFLTLGTKAEREVRARFDYWIDGGINDDYFHGWPNEQSNSECFVFKWKEKRLRHRFYGFLYHPFPVTNPRFVLCVLVSHAVKTQRETDPRQKQLMNSLRIDAAVLAAIAAAFPDGAPQQRKWLN